MHPKPLIEHASALVAQLLRFEHPADAVLSRFLRNTQPRLGPRDRASVAETGYAVLRHKLKFDAFARSGTGPPARRLAILGFALTFPGDAAYLDGALSPPERDWLARIDLNAPPEHVSHAHNLPEWLAQALATELGSEAEMLTAAAELLHMAPLDLRVNVLKQKRESAIESIASVATHFEATFLSPLGIRLSGRPPIQDWEAFQNGSLEVQDEGSQLLALLLDAKRGEMVCDFCAGAGGKTLALGAAMRNTGRLYAFDTSAHRLDGLKPRLARSGLSNVHPVAIADENDPRIKRLAGKMDRVLVDAPCTGLGTLRRNPDLKWRQKPSDVSELQSKQVKILQKAASLVKSGGRLVYATCSLLHAENEDVAGLAGLENKGFTRVNVQDLLADLKIPTESKSDHALATDGFLRLWPHRHQTDGFFAAVWQKA